MSFKKQNLFYDELFSDQFRSPFIMSKFSIAIGILGILLWEGGDGLARI